MPRVNVAELVPGTIFRRATDHPWRICVGIDVPPNDQDYVFVRFVTCAGEISECSYFWTSTLEVIE